MKNITLSIDDEVLEAGREYARRHHISFNALVRRLLRQTVMRSSDGWLVETFALMDKVGGNSSRKKWRREDLYRA